MIKLGSLIEIIGRRNSYRGSYGVVYLMGDTSFKVRILEKTMALIYLDDDEEDVSDVREVLNHISFWISNKDVREV